MRTSAPKVDLHSLQLTMAHNQLNRSTKNKKRARQKNRELRKDALVDMKIMAEKMGESSQKQKRGGILGGVFGALGFVLQLGSLFMNLNPVGLATKLATKLIQEFGPTLWQALSGSALGAGSLGSALGFSNRDAAASLDAGNDSKLTANELKLEAEEADKSASKEKAASQEAQDDLLELLQKSAEQQEKTLKLDRTSFGRA